VSAVATVPTRLGLGLSNEVPIAQTTALVQLAESLGFTEAWIPEVNHGRTATSVVAHLAGVTSTIGLGIGVINPFWRHPSLIAMETATLDELTGGRLRMGIGPAVWSLRALGEDDGRIGKPLTATVDTLRIVAGMLRGEDNPGSTLFPIRTDTRLSFEPFRRHVPLYVGAVNQRMLEASGAWADGVALGAITSPGYAAWAAGRVADGARAAGRDPGDVDLIGHVLISVDRDRRVARNATRRVIASYIARVERVVIEHSGADPDAVAEAQRAVREDGIAAAVDRIADSLIDTFAAAGTPEDAAERVAVYRAAGLRTPIAWHVLGPDPQQALRLIANEVLV
jgi:5,10-methylenetetrahydromethanopterin reductase